MFGLERKDSDREGEALFGLERKDSDREGDALTTERSDPELLATKAFLR